MCSVLVLWALKCADANMTLQFTVPGSSPLISRIVWAFRRTARWLLGLSVPRSYVRRRIRSPLNLPYLIVDNAEKGEMLSETWNKFRHHPDRRANLFSGLARVMLSLARIPFPRIGSLTINDSGVLGLANRPLTLAVHLLETLAKPTKIPRDLTYTTSDVYYIVFPNPLLKCEFLFYARLEPARFPFDNINIKRLRSIIPFSYICR